MFARRPSTLPTSLPLVAGALLAGLLWRAPERAHAAEYEADIEITTELDLYDLHAQHVISDATLETLVELLLTGVDLKLAPREDLYGLPGLSHADVDRILAYRDSGGVLDDPAALAESGTLTAAQVRRISPFLVHKKKRHKRAHEERPATGRIQLRSRYTVEDPLGPPAMFRARLKLRRGVSAGLALGTTRFRLGAVRFDATRSSLVADAARYRLHAPKYFIQLKNKHMTLTAGTFQAGFAERLTLDTTGRRTPSGAYPDDGIQLAQDLSKFCRYAREPGADAACPGLDAHYVTPDSQWQDGFRGLSASFERIPLGPSAKVAIHAFGSYQRRSIYQYELFDRRVCADPRATTEECRAPSVIEASSGRSLSFVTLPNVYDQLVAGGNTTLTLAERMHLGVTGYYATTHFRVPGVYLDFQESSPHPFGGAYGALGANAAVHTGPLHLSIEGARSFDQMPGAGGGFGVIQRSVYAAHEHDVELSLRYYERTFANPFARSISAPGELEGLRARNELGARVRYFLALQEVVRVRFVADAWTLPTDGAVPNTASAVHLDVSARTDFVGSRVVQVAAWLDYANKDVSRNGRGLCYDGAARELGIESHGNGLVCHGELHRLTGKVTLSPFGAAHTFSVQYGHAMVSDPRYARSYRHDGNLWGEISSHPHESVRVYLRCRYLHKALDDDRYLERSLLTYVDIAFTVQKELKGRARYGVLQHLDQRVSTLARTPNPEHRLQLELESHF